MQINQVNQQVNFKGLPSKTKKVISEISQYAAKNNIDQSFEKMLKSEIADKKRSYLGTRIGNYVSNTLMTLASMGSVAFRAQGDAFGTLLSDAALAVATFLKTISLTESTLAVNKVTKKLEAKDFGTKEKNFALQKVFDINGNKRFGNIIKKLADNADI